MIKAKVAVGNGVDLSVDALLIGVSEKDEKLPAVARAADRAAGGIAAAALAAGDVRGRRGELHVFVQASKKKAPLRVMVVGLGAGATPERLRAAAGTAARRARRLGLKSVGMLLPAVSGKDGVERASEAIVQGFMLGGYKSPVWKKKPPAKPPTLTLTLLVKDQATAKRARPAARDGAALAEGTMLARDLINRPGNDLPPRELAAAARKMARAKGLACRVFGKADLTRMKAGGILAVGQGSVNPPCLIQLEHDPTRAGKASAKRKATGGKKRGAPSVPTVYVIGKGITFDTGGISLKPPANMDKMKYDMGGAAAVVGIMSAVASLKLPVHVVGLIASAENMPSSNAYKPGDIITQLDGTTVEVINTDAEGRIVLGDALAYAAKRKPAAMIDLATLTGACTIALGSRAIALMSNDDDLADAFNAAGRTSGERVWRLPLWESYRPLMASDVADVKNSGGREAATITAAIFLEKFVDGHPWVHLDIASTAWSDRDQGHHAKGGIGVGVALVTRFLRDLA